MQPDATSEARPPAASAALLTWVSRLSFIVFAGSSATLSVSLKQIGEDLGLGDAKLGSLGLARSLALATAALVSGFAADRFGKKRFLIAGMAAGAAGVVGVSSADSLPALLAFLALTGVGLGVLESLVSPLVAELHPDDVGFQVNILHGFFPLGIIGTSLIVSQALSRGASWRAPFAIVGAGFAAAMVGFAAGRYPGGRAGAAAPLRLQELAANRTFRLLAAAMFFGAAAEGGLFYWAPKFVQDEFLVTPAVGGLALTLFSITMMAGRLGLSGTVRRGGAAGLTAGLALLGAGASACMAFAPTVHAALVFAGVCGLSVSLFWPGVLTVAAEGISVSSARVFALLSVVGIAGFGLAPPAIGLITEAYDLRRGLVVVPVCCAAFCVLMVLAAARGRRGVGRSRGAL
jgi:CP family cyanate transporter-like MFS transporter